MTACSKNWVLLLILFVFAVGNSIEYGIGSSIVITTGIALGVVLTLIVGHLLGKLDEDRLYGGEYYTLGVTITYEYLFGKKGMVRQVYAIFMLVSLPVFILTAYVSPVSSRQFWLFVVPMDVISIIIAYCLLKALNKKGGSRKTHTNESDGTGGSVRREVGGVGGYAYTKRHFLFLLFFLLASGLFVVFGFAVEFGRRHGSAVYGFAPPLLIVYAFYLLGAFIAGDSLRGKIRRDHLNFLRHVFQLYLIVAAGTWMLSHNVIFSLSLLVIGLSSAIGFTAEYFHLVYPSIILFDAIAILNHNPLILTLGLCFLALYFLFLRRWKHEVKDHDDTTEAIQKHEG